MALHLGTDNGVWRASETGCDQVGLAGKRVVHVAAQSEVILAAVRGEGLYCLAADGARRVWTGDVRSCAIAPDHTFYFGMEPAMIYRSADSGRTWERLRAIDDLPTRSEWTFPVPPHEPHVLSVDFLPDDPDGVLAGVEVGGVLLSSDRGETWCERNHGVYVDVHSVRPDPSAPGHFMAVTGAGFYTSDNGGDTWQQRMDGMEHRYTVGLAINPQRAGEVLVSAGTSPPGLNGRLYHSTDAGQHWAEVQDPALPRQHDRAPVPIFDAGIVWLAADGGQLFTAAEARGRWILAHRLPAAINALAAGGSPSSVMH